MITGKIYTVPPVCNQSSTFLAVDSKIFKMTQKLNKILDTYQPSTHTILYMQNYQLSDTILLLFNKKRVILFDSQTKQVVNYCDFPANQQFLTALSTQQGTFVVLRKSNVFVLYSYENNQLKEIFSDEYFQIPSIQSRPSITIQFFSNQLIIANNKYIYLFRDAAMTQKIVQPAKISTVSVFRQFVFVGLISGQILVYQNSLASQPLQLNYHHNAVLDIQIIPCESGLPVAFSSDFNLKIAKWLPQKNNYRRQLIGNLLSCCYNLQFPINSQYLYAQLDCNKIVVFDFVTSIQIFTISSSICGQNQLSDTKFFTPKLLDNQLLMQSVPGCLEIVTQVFPPFYTSQILNIYHSYSDTDFVKSSFFTTDFLPQIKHFSLLQKQFIVCVLESQNQYYSNDILIICTLQGDILFQINNVLPQKVVTLFTNERNIFLGCQNGIMQLQFDAEQLQEIGFFCWPDPREAYSVTNYESNILTVRQQDTQLKCKLVDGFIEILSRQSVEDPKDGIENMQLVSENVYVGEAKGQRQILIKLTASKDEMQQQQMISALDQSAFLMQKEADIMISKNVKFKINHPSHLLPDGEQILEWIIENAE